MTVLLLPVALVVGVCAHELAHAAVASLGGEVRDIDLWNLHVDFVPASERHETAVRHAPFVIGLVLLPVLLSDVLAGRGGVLSVSLWVAFALTGGQGELGVGWVAQKFSTARGRPTLLQSR